MSSAIKHGVWALLVTLLLAMPALAYDLTELYPDWKAMDAANRAVRNGKMDSAFNQYMSAAKYGNKEAQKLVGLSYLDGSGVKQDNVQACAWLKLAASFQDPRVIIAFNDLHGKISDADREAAEKVYGKLQKSYGDKAALKKRKKWVHREMRDMSGSGAKRPSPTTRVQIFLSPGRANTVTMGELQDVLDSYVDDFEKKMDG